MIRPVPRIASTWLVLSMTAMLVAGCGGSGNGAAEARFVAFANTICFKINSREATTPPTPTERARLRVLEKSARKAPRVATFLSDLAARRRLRTALSKLPNKGFNVVPDGRSYLDKAYRLSVRVYADEKALGLTSCLGKPPRKPIEG
jgi:hypothetical protein